MTLFNSWFKNSNKYNVSDLKHSKKLRRETQQSKHIPYSHHLDDHTVESFDGSICQVIEFTGLAYSVENMNYLTNLRDHRSIVFTGLANKGFVIYQHVIKVDANVKNEHITHNILSKKINQAYFEDLNNIKSISIFLTICKPVDLIDKYKNPEQLRTENLEQMNMSVKILCESLSNYSPKRLSVYKGENGILYSEPLRFFSYLLNFKWRDVPLPFNPINKNLSYTRPIFGTESIEMVSADDHFFITPIVVKEYPEQSYTSLTDNLLMSEYQYVLMQYNKIQNKDWSLHLIDSKKNMSMSFTPDAQYEMDILDDQRSLIQSDMMSLCDHQLILFAIGKTPQELTKAVEYLVGAMEKQSMICVREMRVGIDACFYANLPTNFRYITRKYPITTTNMASFVTLHNFPTGKRKHNWGKPVTTLKTVATTGYDFGFHVEDVGFFTLLAGTGGGKTTFLNFLLSESLKYDPVIVMFDCQQGSRIFIEALGGSYVTFGNDDETAEKKAFSGMTPFSCEKTAYNKELLFNLVKIMVTRTEKEFSEDNIEKLSGAIDRFFDLPSDMRNINTFAEMLTDMRDKGVGYRFKSWHGTGKNAWLFGGDAESTRNLDIKNDYLGFDLTNILKDKECNAPALYYMIKLAKQKITGHRPTIFIFEEGWAVKDEPLLVNEVDEFYRTGRRNHLIAGFVSQNAKDFDGELGNIIVGQSPTKIFLPNNRDSATIYNDTFELTEDEKQWITSTAEHSRQILIKQGKKSVPINFNLFNSKLWNYINILSTRKKHIELWSRLKQQLPLEEAIEEFIKKSKD